MRTEPRASSRKATVTRTSPALRGSEKPSYRKLGPAWPNGLLRSRAVDRGCRFRQLRHAVGLGGCLDHLDASRSGPPDHIRSSPSTGERHNHIRPAFIQHGLIADRPGLAPELLPFGAKLYVLDARRQAYSPAILSAPRASPSIMASMAMRRASSSINWLSGSASS